MRKPVKVNLGSGKDYLSDWINIDIASSYKVDLIADLSQKFPFADDSIDELKASDILEHFTKEDGKKFLKECHRVLKNGGLMTIRTHNILQIFRQFQNDPEVLIHFLYGDTDETGIFGAHKYAYTKGSLTYVFKKIGFDILSFEHETTNFVMRIRKTPYKPLSNLSIAIIMQSPDIGGAETYMHTLVTKFLQKKCSVIVVSNKSKFLMWMKQLPIQTYEQRFVIDIMGDWKGLIKTIFLFLYALFYYIRLLHRFKKDGVNVILMSGFTEKLFVSWLSTFFNIPVVWIEYGRLELVFKRNLYFPKFVYRMLKYIPKYVIVPSENTKSSQIIHARMSLAKLHLVPCGVKIPTRLPIKRRRQPLTLQKVFLIGNVSRLTREKGQDYLIKAMPHILKKIPSAHLVIIGDGPDKKYYEDLIAQLDMQDYITLTGFVKDLEPYYAAMDLFVFPTVWDLEGFGLVVPEAMARKIPVIGSNLGPVPEIIDDRKTGLLFPPGDAYAIADTVITLYKNKEDRRSFANNAYEKTKKLYDLEKVSQKVLEILSDAAMFRS